jgi:hypothetical protein
MQGFVLESQGQRKIVIQTGERVAVFAGIGDLPSYIAPAATFYDPGDGAYQDPNVAEDISAVSGIVKSCGGCDIAGQISDSCENARFCIGKSDRPSAAGSVEVKDEIGRRTTSRSNAFPSLDHNFSFGS